LEIKIDSFDFDSLKIIDENGQYVEYNLKEELKVNEANLLLEMLQQPSKYIYWASILEKIKYFQEAQELELEMEVAQLDEQARKFITDNGGKPTKDIVEAYIKRQPSYQQARTNCQYYEYIGGRIGRIVKAFEQRKDMLQSYGKQIAEDKLYGRGAGSSFEKLPDQSPFGQ
jgi:hypothetical protein